MVHSVKRDVVTAEKSNSHVFPLKYKRRKVSAKREFPQSCGRKAPQANPKPGEEGSCPENLEFLLGSGRIAPLISAKSNVDGASVGSVENGAALVEPPPANGGVDIALQLQVFQPYVPVEVVDGSMHKRYPSRRRVSASRDYPPHCGRRSSGLRKEKFSGVNNCELIVGDVAGKPVDEGCTSHQSQGEEYVGIEPSKDRVIGSIVHPLVDEEDHKDGCVTRHKVRETLRLFQAIVRKLLKDEESKSKDDKSGTGRVDRLAGNTLKQKGKWVNTGASILGDVPGVEVGDEFRYRVELVVIGLHRPFQSGIDYLNRDGKLIATSIVSSGAYDDKFYNSDELLYSGQGGNPKNKDKAEDQKLEGGNLSLKNSLDEQTPVRVIHGFKETKRIGISGSKVKIVATYTYDGLYLVERYWPEKGPYNTIVYKFQLRRKAGQPELAMKVVKKAKKGCLRPGLCEEDISQGKEKMPISAINTVDDEKPHQFEYIPHMTYPSLYNLSPSMGCECIDGCSDSEKCNCAVKNGGEIPFNYDRAIVIAKPLVHECGPSCKCPPSCHNRVSQHGIQFELEIFKTESSGWGVRSLTSIPSGSFICEYTGELLQDKEAEERTNNDEYLFDIGRNYSTPAVFQLPDLIPPDLKTSDSCKSMEDVGFTIDAAQYGSVGRFINHSCSPNLYAQNLLYDHGDLRMPHVMLFASENIPPLQELTYHYNYMLDQVHDSDGNIKKKSCYCGTSECSGRLY
ncbi:hypothetical protein IFM89_004517 [Coptis chinensis]|uniref:Uncharacterized protein n=1 Tax=Coptis chinensis TaxID=261450 RepID=A0A835GWB2_9MAGN|nr:hypothetical protein IFM89_004517 [Coptis chinensis]